MGDNKKISSFKDVEDDVIKYIEDTDEDFINSLAHDLKNALGIIELSVGLIEYKVSKVFENASNAEADKIKDLVDNAHIGLERSRKILDHALILKGSSIDKIVKINMRTTFDEFQIFAKNSLKDSNIEIQNDIPEGITLEKPVNYFGNLIIKTVDWFTRNIKQGYKYELNINFKDEKLVFTCTCRENNQLLLLKDELSITDQIASEVFDSLFKQSGSSYTVEKDDKALKLRISL